MMNHIFRYLVGTKDYGIIFALNKPSSLVGYTDSDYIGCLGIRKSTYGYYFMFGHGSISLNPKLQECMATSTTECHVYYGSGIHSYTGCSSRSGMVQ